MSSKEILNEFKRNIIDFLDELIDLFPSESQFVLGRIILKDRIGASEIMANFIQYIVPHRAQIEQENDDFFLEHASSLFGPQYENKISHIKVIWKSDNLSVDDRRTIWSWFKAFLVLSDHYTTSMG